MRAAQGSETLGDQGGPHGGFRALLYACAAMHWAVLLSGCAAAPHLHPLVLMGARFLSPGTPRACMAAALSSAPSATAHSRHKACYSFSCVLRFRQAGSGEPII